MNNNEMNIDSGVRLSFIELFHSRNYRIEIPIIQRDYAQGRESAINIRRTFLSALHTYLEEDVPFRDLDFVYGSVKNKNGDNCFIPLDGQQRLTTLFLLHWYLSLTVSAEKFGEFKNVLSFREKKRVISKFSYEIRVSSREFCSALLTHGLDLNNLLKADRDKQNQISKTVRNKGWYFLSWDSDPTIQSMLNMLDSIHEKFEGRKDFYDKLVDKEKPIITFLFLNLSEFKLTDDLYIKMNARGKPLTSFENFKAKFEQFAADISWTSEEQRELDFEGQKKIVNPKDYFSFKIDTSWADLFWNYRGLVGKNESYDEELMSFIRVALSSFYAEKIYSEKDSSNFEHLIGTQVAKKKQIYTDDLTFQHYLEFNTLNKESIIRLLDSFDILSNGTNEIKTYISDDFYFNEEVIFNNVLSHSLSQVNRIRFYAYMEYLIQNRDSIGVIDDWMRIVYNLTENRIIDRANDVSSAIRSIQKLLPEAHRILDFLRQEEINVDFFASRQIEEEQIKSRLIAIDNKWKEAIISIEKHPYFKGQIGFILEYSGIIDYYLSENNCNWSAELNVQMFNAFSTYAIKAGAVFKIIDTEKGPGSASLNYAWERAVLCHGDYLLIASQWRKNFLSTSRNMRDYSWKRLLRLSSNNSKSEDINLLKARRELVKAVIDNPLFDTKNLLISLERICSEKMPTDWRGYFVNEPKLIAYCEQGFIRFNSSDSIILLRQSQQNHRQRELRTYNFYLKELKGRQLIRPFNNSWHYEVRSGEEVSHAVIDELSINGKDFEIDIYYDANSAGNGMFRIRFFKSSGDNSEELYPQALNKALAEYNWIDDEGFYKLVNSELNLKQTLAIFLKHIECHTKEL